MVHRVDIDKLRSSSRVAQSGGGHECNQSCQPYETRSINIQFKGPSSAGVVPSTLPVLSGFIKVATDDAQFSIPYLGAPFSQFHTNYITYNQTLVLTPDKTIDFDALAVEGLPNLTVTYLMYLITSNAGITAALMHLAIWNYDDLKSGWSFVSFANLKKLGKRQRRNQEKTVAKRTIMDTKAKIFSPHR